jgi:hypothetical protein
MVEDLKSLKSLILSQQVQINTLSRHVEWLQKDVQKIEEKQDAQEQLK